MKNFEKKMFQSQILVVNESSIKYPFSKRHYYSCSNYSISVHILYRIIAFFFSSTFSPILMENLSWVNDKHNLNPSPFSTNFSKMSHLLLTTIINSNIRLTLFLKQVLWLIVLRHYLSTSSVCSSKTYKLWKMDSKEGAQKREIVTRMKNRKSNKQALFFINTGIFSIGAPPTDWSPNESVLKYHLMHVINQTNYSGRVFIFFLRNFAESLLAVE